MEQFQPRHRRRSCPHLRGYRMSGGRGDTDLSARPSSTAAGRGADDGLHAVLLAELPKAIDVADGV